MALHWCALTMALLTAACSTPAPVGTDPLAGALITQAEVIRQRILDFEAGRSAKGAAPFLKVQFKGKPAYLFISPCCDRFNYLYDAEGTRLCAPSGGFGGAGDGKCPGALNTRPLGPAPFPKPERSE